ncbi:NAD(P) transhydrogenase subunit beta (plasmid) [Serratia marcescens]|nr:NAD(P) transhydrogenase subunit beta [Serratia marcescens]
MTALLVALSGLVAAMLFVLGLKRMSSPVTAPHGIVLAGVGMVIAVIASFGYVVDIDEAARPHLATNLGLVILALAVGGILAWRSGRKVAVTGMPQMVALYNGMGGGSAAALAAVELMRGGHESDGFGLHLAVTVLGALIGAVSLSGSVIAWAKLDGRINKPWRFPGQRVLNGLVLVGALVVGVYLVMTPSAPILWPILFFSAALAFGVLMTLPIGGADMPVVISLYNAFTGLAVALEGFALQNPALMIAGMVVGSAGTLLTIMMARAMNRSLTNVLLSNFGESAAAGDTEVTGQMTSVEPGDAAISMRYASSVIIVPGYGLAVAQAQARLYELVKLLQAADVDVKFAIHPVAGRMPGHMNVLLAEAGVPYDLIFDMEDINDSFAATDVALVLGANDVVNPAARIDKSSPVYGMPIVNVDHARQSFVIKRGQGKGYAGIENLLFYQDNCDMVYGDAQAVLTKMVQAIKDLDA